MLTFIYFVTSFTGAFLLFMVQPMAAKVLLPVLGGTPAVWNGSMLFFQSVLLLAYLYAHLGARYIGVRKQALMHIALVIAVLVVSFPISYSPPWDIAASDNPVLWLFAMLVASVGLPYFVVACTAPLLQYWLSTTTHHHSENPYFLYAASNAGSLIGLLSFPLLIEPAFNTGRQGEYYGYGYAALALLLIVAALRLFANENENKNEKERKSGVPQPKTEENTTPPSWRTKLHWLALAFIPASLLYGVTTYITTDIVSIPLLWVIPLTLYLLSFIMVFAHSPFGYRTARKIHLPLVIIAIVSLSMLQFASLWMMVLHLLIFFVCAVVCHGMLVEKKPDAVHLTEFYLCMAFGGMLGGMFNTLLAPHIFSGAAEYPLMLMATLLLRSQPSLILAAVRENWTHILRNIVQALIIGGLFVAGYYMLDKYLPQDAKPPLSLFSVFLIFVITWLLIEMSNAYKTGKEVFTPVLISVLALYAAMPLIISDLKKTGTIFRDRNFFGISRVQLAKQYDAHMFLHGTTLHGIQSTKPQERLKPLTYYGALVDVFSILPSDLMKKPMAVVGMGVGTIACYGNEGQTLDMFEIDPLVVRIAGDEKLFTYISDCPPDINIIMGDGRISLSKMPLQNYGVMVLDAFSSDAIPAHLLTKEAVAMYSEKITGEGVIAFNISNRHMNLEPVLATIAQELQLKVRSKYFVAQEENPLSFSSRWVVMTRNGEITRRLDEMGWNSPEHKGREYLWTDDFSNIVRVLEF